MNLGLKSFAELPVGAQFIFAQAHPGVTGPTHIKLSRKSYHDIHLTGRRIMRVEPETVPVVHIIERRGYIQRAFHFGLTPVFFRDPADLSERELNATLGRPYRTVSLLDKPAG